MYKRQVRVRSKTHIFLIVGLLHYYTRRFAPRAASAAHYARSQAIEQNVNEADREVHEFRCKLTTCKCQELNARGYQPGRRIMYRHVPGTKCTYEESKEIQEGSPTNNFLVGNYGLSRAERWEDMPSMSSEAGDT